MSGEKWGHTDRMKQAVTTESKMPPTLNGLPKDHKQVEEGEEPPMQPIRGANCEPGSKISNILAKVISPLNEAIAGESLVKNIEDLQTKPEAIITECSSRTFSKV